MIIRKLICPDSPRGFMEGSGAGSGGGDSNNNNQGTAFGVNGVSATGSTATDAAIGFTSSEGSNEAGANFGGLSGATSSQVANAVSAAQAAQKGGGDLGAQQAAAGLSLAGQAPSVAASNAISDAGLAAQAAEAAQAQVAAQNQIADNALISLAQQNQTANIAQMSPEQAAQEGYTVADIAAAQAAQQGMMVDPVTGNIVDTPAQAFINAQQEGLNALAAIQAAHEADASLFGMGENINSEMSGTTNAAAEGLVSGISSLAPAQVGPPAAQMAQIGPNQTTDLSAMIDAAVAADNAYGVSPTGYNLANQQTGYVSPVQSGETGQYTINGVPVSTQFAEQMIANQQQVVEGLPSPSAGLMGYMGKVPGVLGTLAALTGYDPTKSAAEAYGTMLAMPGAEVDAAGNITAPAGRGTLNYSQTLGGVTYSGMPDAGYSGPFSGLVNPGSEPQNGSDIASMAMEEEPVVNPCPEGYSLVDGVCQPFGNVQAAAPTAITPPPAPMAFQPMYQPFQPQQINPFVLSPTGAALGRSV